MIDKIKIEIENNNLEFAKGEIQKLEESLLTEKSDYIRCKTLEKINKYKALYLEKIQFEDKDLKKLDIKIEPEFETFKSKDSLIYADLNDQIINLSRKFKTGKITNCKSCTFNFFEIDESLVIENCEDCIFFCKTKQLRIKNSSKLTLQVFIEAGTSLENSKEISFSDLKFPPLDLQIHSLSLENDPSSFNFTNDLTNNYKNVKDFTNPFDSTNYHFKNCKE